MVLSTISYKWLVRLNCDLTRYGKTFDLLRIAVLKKVFVQVKSLVFSPSLLFIGS